MQFIEEKNKIHIKAHACATQNVQHFTVTFYDLFNSMLFSLRDIKCILSLVNTCSSHYATEIPAVCK